MTAEQFSYQSRPESSLSPDPGSRFVASLGEAALSAINEIEVAKRQAREKLRANAVRLDLLRKAAAAETPVRAEDFDGPLGEWIGVATSEQAKSALTRWADYFKSNLDDLNQLITDVENGTIRDPDHIYRVVRMSEGLLGMAKEAVKFQVSPMAS